jgi:hypothetical protein
MCSRCQKKDPFFPTLSLGSLFSQPLIPRPPCHPVSRNFVVKGCKIFFAFFAQVSHVSRHFVLLAPRPRVPPIVTPSHTHTPTRSRPCSHVPTSHLRCKGLQNFFLPFCVRELRSLIIRTPTRCRLVHHMIFVLAYLIKIFCVRQLDIKTLLLCNEVNPTNENQNGVNNSSLS